MTALNATHTLSASTRAGVPAAAAKPTIGIIGEEQPELSDLIPRPGDEYTLSYGENQKHFRYDGNEFHEVPERLKPLPEPELQTFEGKGRRFPDDHCHGHRLIPRQPELGTFVERTVPARQSP